MADILRKYYGSDPRIIYLYAQHRPLRKTEKYVLIDRTYRVIEKLEIEAESYINMMAQKRTGRGKHLGDHLRDCRNSYRVLKQIRRWTEWKPASGRSIDEYYRRREHE